jgi:hypothetical protein
MGPSLDRPILHVPVSPRVRSLADLPQVQGRVEETTLLPAVLAATVADADRDAWRRRVLESPARHLFIAKTPIVAGRPPPPELAWAAKDAATFRRIFENDAAAIYAVRRESSD